MEDPHTREQWHELIATLIDRNAPHNSAADMYVYWQVTRGTEYGRNHAPLPKLARTVFADARMKWAYYLVQAATAVA